ncbi:MAG: hypothetical protein LBB41_02650 [Prevotellaceae bacterium]|jgi:hypothetical protein|nr:hypothetical protein [Prevotellaceae bacterium]
MNLQIRDEFLYNRTVDKFFITNDLYASVGLKHNLTEPILLNGAWITGFEKICTLFAK